MTECKTTKYVFNDGIITKLCNEDNTINICHITPEQKKEITEL